MTPEGRARRAQSYPRPSLPLALRTAGRSHERREEILSSLLSLSRGGKRKRVLWREGEHSGAFFKILHCIQDHKWNAKQGGGERLGLGLPIPIGPHKGTGAVERFHIAEPKGSTSVRDRSMSRRLVPAALKSTYALFPVH
ncbi:hypothetical protein VNO77_46256 [Canavalia gladiata]|uniref:Uncharacterized protein n=1 Tax=Canavalia gladiata TaxID=3824 RepID=A0AAN9PG00_CANGL